MQQNNLLKVSRCVLVCYIFSGCTAATSDDACDVIDETATCGEAFEFPLNVPENITQLHIHSTQVKSIGKNVSATNIIFHW